MTERPSNRLVAAQLAALAAAVLVAVLKADESNWDAGLIATLLAIAVVSDLVKIGLPVHRVFVSASFLTIVIAAVLLGASAAAGIGVLTILTSWARERYSGSYLLINLVTYAWFPLAAGFGFEAAADATGAAPGEPIFYLLIFAVFALALALDFVLIAGYTALVEETGFGSQVRQALLPLLPSELASAMLAVGVAYAYVESGTEAVALLGTLVIVFQYLTRALLISQQRAEELERRAAELAGFQVALLSTLVRTLDMRDRVTARHSAVVARYARELAAEAGLSQDEQDLAHTAGLLHDVGKFLLSDRVLRASSRELDEDDWAEIRTHPEQGARIVAQVAGYEQVAEVIRAHHERIDGQGYPRGLSGEQIPTLARVIAVADAYDAMTAQRSYRRPLVRAEAIVELREVAGTQLDPRFVAALIRVLEREQPGPSPASVDFESELQLDRRIQASRR